MKKQKLFIGLFIAALTFTSCSDDEGVDFQPVTPVTPDTPSGAYENGILLTNEGGFGNGNATVSYISDDYNTVNNGLYYFHNNEALGDTAQNIGIDGELAYIVVNASNKIEVVNRYTFESITTIDTGLVNPRYIAFSNGKGYVTNWGDVSDPNDDFIAIINLENNTVTQSIAVSNGPERILAHNNSVYISRGYLSNVGSNITIINSLDDTKSTLEIGLQPDTMILDTSNNIWIQCKGDQWGSPEIGGKLVKINTESNTVDTSFEFPTEGHPGHLGIDNNDLYYHMNGEVYKMNISDSSLPNSPVLSTIAYGFAVNNGKLFATDPLNYSDPGLLKIFDLSNNTEIETINVGVNPSGIHFN